MKTDRRVPRRQCARHRGGQPCSCAMGNLYRFIEPVVLYLLRTRGRTHGYDLAREMQEHALTDSAVDAGALYRTLRRLEEGGYVESTWDVSGVGPARRVYQLTPVGEEHLREWAVVLDHLAGSMHRFVADVNSVTAEARTDG